MDIITLAMTTPKVIDLTQYSATNNGTLMTFNDALLALYAQGGGTVSATGGDCLAFWDEVNTDKPLVFVIDAGAAAAVTLHCSATSLGKGADHQKVTAIGFGFLLNIGGTLARATVTIGGSWYVSGTGDFISYKDEVNLTLVLEQLA